MTEKGKYTYRIHTHAKVAWQNINTPICRTPKLTLCAKRIGPVISTLCYCLD
jgi:hypothetical protein